MMFAKVGGVPLPFELLASPVNGRVSVIVRVGGTEHRFTLDAKDAADVSKTFAEATIQALHHHGKS